DAQNPATLPLGRRNRHPLSCGHRVSPFLVVESLPRTPLDYPPSVVDKRADDSTGLRSPTIRPSSLLTCALARLGLFTFAMGSRSTQEHRQRTPRAATLRH